MHCPFELKGESVLLGCSGESEESGLVIEVGESLLEGEGPSVRVSGCEVMGGHFVLLSYLIYSNHSIWFDNCQ
jgi:hypothetical protein